jgi:hypothetical protein
LEARAIFGDNSPIFAMRALTVVRIPSDLKQNLETFTDVKEGSLLSKGSISLSANLASNRIIYSNSDIPIQIVCVNEKKKSVSGVCFLVLSIQGSAQKGEMGKPIQFRLPNEISFEVEGNSTFSHVLEVPLKNVNFGAISKCPIEKPEINLASLCLKDVLQNEIGKIEYEAGLQEKQKKRKFF